MANGSDNLPPWKPRKGGLGRVRGSAQEAKARAAADKAERKAAGEHPRSIILNQKDVLTGQWNPGKVLFTTLGGELRPITAEDLATFRLNIRTAQKHLTHGGITARQVIDFSLGVDRVRANEEIKLAVPVSASNGKLRYLTNAGPDSEVTRHHVQVEFLNYQAEASSGARDARKAALRLRKSPLRIECDCGRWRYWYRYIATIGGFNADRAETGYPKIRNPKLQGIACKHLLRVMHDVESGGATLAFLTRLLEKAQADEFSQAKIRQTQSEAERTVKKQAKSDRILKTSEQKVAEWAQRAAERGAFPGDQGSAQTFPAGRGHAQSNEGCGNLGSTIRHDARTGIGPVAGSGQSLTVGFHHA